MRKLAFFTIIFILLGVAVWGQNTYRYNGAGTNWLNSANWVVLTDGTDDPMDPQPFPATYPGQNSPYEDIVIIPYIQPTQITFDNFTQNLTVKSITVSNNIWINVPGAIVFEIENLTVKDNATFGSSNTVFIDNITLDSGHIQGTFSMHGSIITAVSWENRLVINPILGNLGNLNAGSKNVEITVRAPPPVLDIDIGNITSSGNITVTILGDGHNISIGDITAGGGVTITVPGNSEIDVNSIDAGGPVDYPPDKVTIGGTNLVVGIWDEGDQPSNLFGAGVGYYYVDIKTLSSGTVVTTTDYADAINIYIINVGDIGARSLTFDAPSGYIEIRGSYETTGTITLAPAANRGLRLNGANINLPQSGGTFNANVPVTLNGTPNAINGQTINLGIITGNNNNLYLDASAVTVIGSTNINILTMNGGTVTLGPSTTPTPTQTIHANEINVNTTAVIRTDITTTATQQYDGTFTLTQHSPGYQYTLTSTTGQVSIDGPITGSNCNLVFEGNARFGGASGLVSLTVNGSLQINGNVTTTTGGQFYNGPVSLGDNITFTGNADTTICFGSTVSGTVTPRAFRVDNGIVIFDGAVGGNISTVRLGGEPTGTNAHQINADITTVGAGPPTQLYYGNVRFGGNVNLTGPAGATIAFDGLVNGPGGLTITGAEVQFYSQVGVDAALGYINVISSSTQLQTNNTGIRTTGDQSYGGTITFAGANARTLTSTAGNIQTSVITGTGTANDLTINSTEGSITINGNITNLNRLVLTAPGTTGSITIPDGVTITVQSANGHTVNNDTASGAIYINTPTLNVPGTTGTIGSASTGRVCLEMNPISHGGRIQLPCWHALPTGINYVYGNNPSPGEFGSDYYIIDSSLPDWGSSITLRPGTGFHIIIINNGTGNPGNSRALTLEVGNAAATDYIEFRGDDYTSSAALNIVAGPGGVRLNDAGINIGSNNFVLNTNVPVILNGTTGSTITAGNITLGTISGNSNNSLTLTATLSELDDTNNGNNGIGALTINGNAVFSLPAPAAPTSIIRAASITVTENVLVRCQDVITTGTQSYGSVTFYSAAPAQASRIFTGTTITMGQVNAGTGADAACALVINGDAVFNGANNINIRTLTVSGTATINGNITTTGAATISTIANVTQFYGGNVILGNNVTLTGPAGTLRQIRFNGTVNGIAAGGQSLTVETGNVWFAQAVGGLVPLNYISVAGTTQINAPITTTAVTGNGQNYTGNVTLGATVSLTSGLAAQCVLAAQLTALLQERKV